MQVVIPKQRRKARPEAIDRWAVSVREAAALLSVSERSVWNMAKRGDIQSRHIGGRVVFTVDSIKAFLEGAGAN